MAQHGQGVTFKKSRAAQGDRLGTLDSLNARRRSGFCFWHFDMSSQSRHGYAMRLYFKIVARGMAPYSDDRGHADVLFAYQCMDVAHWLGV